METTAIPCCRPEKTYNSHNTAASCRTGAAAPTAAWCWNILQHLQGAGATIPPSCSVRQQRLGWRVWGGKGFSRLWERRGEAWQGTAEGIAGYSRGLL